VVEPFAEPLEPRGERSLFGGSSVAIVTVCARVVSHAFDTATFSGEIAALRRPEAARTILAGYSRVKNRSLRRNRLESKSIIPFAGLP
jgi:hypothetical protein